MFCTECGGKLNINGTGDDRQEWTEYPLICAECGAEYVHRIEYQTQSSLVERDYIYKVSDGDKWITHNLDMPVFCLTVEDVVLHAEELGIDKDELTYDVIMQVKKGLEWGLSEWPYVMEVALGDILERGLDNCSES